MVFPLGQGPEAAEGGSEVEGEEAEEEAEVPRKAREPSEPTDEERRRHEMAHLPVRVGCPHCVRGRMANPPHRDLGPPGQMGVPEVAMDYCFLSKEEGSKSLTVLVTKDRGSKAIIANAVLCKGRAFEDTVEQAALNIRRFGHLGKVLLKTDNEAALVDLRKGVAKKLGPGEAGADGLQVVTEVPPAHEPQSNGMVES